MPKRILVFLTLIISTAAFCAEIDSLVQRIDARLQSFPHSDRLNFHTTSLEFNMDDNWQPKGITTIEKQIWQHDGTDSTAILSAVEHKDGVDTDITEKTRQKWQEERKKSKGPSAEQKIKLADMLPFTAERRADYRFSILPDTVINGRTVQRIRAIALEKSPERIEGDYAFDPDTYTLVYMDIHPSKNPRFVHLLRMQFHFQLLSKRHWMPQSLLMRLHAKVFVKNFRSQVRETYSDFEFRNQVHSTRAKARLNTLDRL